MQTPGSMDVLHSVGWVIAHTALWALMGRALATVIQAHFSLAALNPHLRLFLLLSLGFSGHLCVLFLFGVTGLFEPDWVLVPCALLALKGLIGLRPTIPSLSSLAQSLPQFLVACFVLGYVLQFAIRAPGYWDDTSFHLPIARFYLEQGGFPVAEHLRFPLFPQHMNLIMAQGLSLQGELLAQMFSAWPLWLLLMGIYGAALHWLRSALAAAFACVPPFLLLPISVTQGYAYTDLGLAALSLAGAVPLMLLALTGSSQSLARQPGLFVLSGLLMGTAASIKLLGLVWAVGWLVLCLAHPALRRGAVWMAAACLLTGSVWYLRALWVSGDPFHPLLGDWLGHFLWSSADLASQRAEQASHGVPFNPLALWDAFAKAGVLWIFPALLTGLVLTRRDRGLGLAWLAWVGYVLFWLKAGQVDRYLAPAYGLGCLLVGVGLWRFGLQRLVWRLMWTSDHLLSRLSRPSASAVSGLTRHAGVIAAAQMIAIFPFTQTDWVDAPARLEAWSTWLNGRAGYSLYERANQLSPQGSPARLVQVGFENGIYFFHGRAVGDWFGPGRYSQFIVCTDRCRMRPSRELIERMDALGISLLLVNTQRFPLDLADYKTQFEVVSQESAGVLLRRAGSPEISQSQQQSEGLPARLHRASLQTP